MDDVMREPQGANSVEVDVSVVKQENRNTEDESMDALDLLAFASCTTELHEIIEFNSTEVMPNPFNENMVCLLCLQDLEKDEITNHMVTEHGYRKLAYKCQICTQTFQLKPELIFHNQTCKAPPKRKKRKSRKKNLEDIELQCKLEPEDLDMFTSCPMCMLEMNKFELKEHIMEMHSNPTAIPTCGLCGRIFKSKVTLRDHIKLVHEVGDTQVPCEICGQIFSSKKYLSNHRRNVHPKGDKEFKCSHCGKIFKSHLCLHQHMKYVHPPESAMVECPQCTKVFKSKMNLHQHIKITHMGARKTKKYNNFI